MVNLNEILIPARKDKYAVGSFNVYSFETIRGVLQCINTSKTPAIIAFGEKYLENMDFDTAVNLVIHLSKDVDVPFALHLDHCSKLENIYRAIKAGFTSVMYDGSMLSYEKNIVNTAKAVEVAHANNVSVEAELGSLASGEHSHEGTSSDEEVYTNPDQAASFVDKTGVDALAVSIGTVHGMYKGTPNIRMDILKKIKEKVAIPLVLHGGSGIPEDVICDCIQNGICKINVNTEISVYVVKQLLELLKKSINYHLSVLSLEETSYVTNVVKKYMTLFKKSE